MSKLTIKAKKNGFRRAGITFSDTEATVVDAAKLKPEQVEALKTDPNLVVVEGEVKAGSATAVGDALSKKLSAAEDRAEAAEKELAEIKAKLEAAEKAGKPATK